VATLLGGLAVMGLGLVIASRFIWPAVEAGANLPESPLPASNWILLWGILGTSILLRGLLGVLDPSPGRVQAAVGNAIMSLITLDAVLVLAACGERWAIAVLMLLAWFLFWKRLVPPT
jgi:hypothetical protein